MTNLIGRKVLPLRDNNNIKFNNLSNHTGSYSTSINDDVDCCKAYTFANNVIYDAIMPEFKDIFAYL